MIKLLISHGADANIKVSTGQTVFDKFLESMPEGCSTILDHYVNLKGTSLSGNDMEIILNFNLLHSFAEETEMAFLHKIVASDRLELLKHPICESFLELKWFRVRKYFYLYMLIYIVFMISLNGLIILDLSPMFKGNNYNSRFEMILFNVTILFQTILMASSKLVTLYLEC